MPTTARTARSCQSEFLALACSQRFELARCDPYFCRRKRRFEGLGMSSFKSSVLGADVRAGEVGATKIDGATGCRAAIVPADS
jgi:hypothetical protein